MLTAEFDRQVATLLAKGYPAVAGLPPDAFLALLAPLRARLAALTLPGPDLAGGRLPFVLMIARGVARAEQAMPLVERVGKPGFVAMNPRLPGEFHPIDGVAIPQGNPHTWLGSASCAARVGLP